MTCRETALHPCTGPVNHDPGLCNTGAERAEYGAASPWRIEAWIVAGHHQPGIEHCTVVQYFTPRAGTIIPGYMDLNLSRTSISNNLRAPGWVADFGYLTRWPLNAKERSDAYSLRAQVFGSELGWAPQTAGGLEVDEFDNTSLHFGIFDPAGRIVATARVTPAGQAWMLDSCFRTLWPENVPLYQHAQACEISRLAVCTELRNRPVHHGVLLVDLLYKALFHFCLLHGIHYSYVAVTPHMLRHMRQRGLVCHRLAPFKRMPDYVDAGVVLVDWNALAQRSSQGRGLVLQRALAPHAMPLDPETNFQRTQDRTIGGRPISLDINFNAEPAR